MSRLALALALSLAAGCAEPLPVMVTNWEFVDGTDDIVREAGWLLGVEAELTFRQYGSAEIILVGEPPPCTGSYACGDGEGTGCAIGQVVRPRGTDLCRPAAWAIVDPLTVAHELGHLLGLEHTDDPLNLMYPIYGGDNLTADQQRQVNRSAGALTACAP